MLKIFIYSFTLVIMFFSFSAVADTAQVLSKHGSWTAYTFMDQGQKVCYMASQPVTDKGNYTKRGEIAALVTHWPAKNSKNVFSYVAGYPYKSGSDVSVSIGADNFSLFTQGEMAWSSDEATDKRLVAALKNGSSMVIKGTSSRGTLTTDTYNLNGATAAYIAISKACGL